MRINYNNFRLNLDKFFCFSLIDIKKIYPNFDLRRLSEWQAKDYIRKVIKAYYIFTDRSLDEPEYFYIANKIYNPSYISFETALQYYGFIPEAVFAITSANANNSFKYNSLGVNFIYNKIKKTMMFGYKLVDINGLSIKIAEPEKAIIDYLYANPHLTSYNDFRELRIDSHLFKEQINLDKLTLYQKQIGSKALDKRIKILKEIIYA